MKNKIAASFNFTGSQSYWPFPMQNPHEHKPLKFTVPDARQFTFAQVDPPPTRNDIAQAFTSYPWAAEIGVAATGEVIARKTWEQTK